MIFEEALGVDDDYIRLQKIGEGIKQIAQTLKTSKTFQSSVLLKQMFCSYPFAEEQIEQLLDECYELYKNDGKFIMAIHKAIQDLASLQEYRQFLGTRSIFSRQNSKLLNNNNVTATLKEQLKQGSIPFSREVIERLIIAKQFSIKYIKPIFQLSFEYKFDLEQLAQIFKVFLQHTKNEEFQQKIIDIYEELKLTVFKDLDWIEQFNQDLEDYFVQNKLKVPPKLIQSKLIHIKTKNKKILQQHYKKNSVKMETESDSLSNSNSPGQPLIIDYKKRIQQWLCNKEIQQLDLDSYVFITNSENFNILISFIVNPAKIDLIDNWQQEFENEVECHNKKYFKNINIQLDKYQIIRSYKATMMIGDINNLKQIDKILTTFIEIIFRRIYEAIISDEINLNLNHIAHLIEQLILFNSQKSIHQILEYNLLFTLSLYIYNHKISTLIGEIISLWIDKFKLGYYVQEQIWKYLDYTNWFNFFFSIMIKQQKRNDQCYKEYKSLKIDGILAFVKLLKSPEKTIQTQPDQLNSITSRQDPVTPIEFSEEQQILNSSQWFLDNNYTANQIMDDGSTKDFDNLKKFNTEKNKSLVSEQDSPLRIRLFQSSYQKGFYTHSSQKSSQSIVSPKNKMSNSSISLPSIDLKLQKSESVDSQSCLNYLTRQRNKTTFVSQDGFSTTKLISIYPRRNIDLQFTNFEITKQSFIYNKYSIKGSIQIIKMIFQSIFNTLNYQENVVKDAYQRQQFINLALRQFITEKTIITIFRVFLYGLFDETNKLLGKLSSECGQIILELFQNGLTLKDKNLNQILKTCFDQTVDYLVKKIIELNNFPHLPEFKFIQNQLTSILVIGLQFYEIYNPDKDDRNIFRNLNETVMHIFIIWFFNSNQNNQFQLNFVKLIAILFSKAPQYQLQNLLFHVGFLTSLFNGFCSYNKNGCKNIEYVESLYMNLTYLIYIIHQNIYFRQLDQLIQNLESSSSWKGLQQGLPTNDNKFIKYLIKLMNIENKDQKKNKINMKFNSLPSSKGTNRNVNEEKMEISQLNEILKQKQVSNDQSTSPMKQQVQIKKLIRYRTKNSIKA